MNCKFCNTKIKWTPFNTEFCDIDCRVKYLAISDARFQEMGRNSAYGKDCIAQPRKSE